MCPERRALRVARAVRAAVLAAVFASPSVHADAPVHAPELTTTPPTLVTFVAAPFPLRETRSSTVDLVLTVGIDGRVAGARVVRSGGADFDAAAAAAARRFVFAPARREGRIVAAKIRYRYTFAYAPPPTVVAPGSRSVPSLALALPETPSGVVVRGMRSRRDAIETKLDAAEAASVAGTAGDPAKVVEDLPGVAHASLGADPLVVWGSPAQDTRVYVDGVEIPSLFHGEALRSTVNGDLIAALSLSPGAYGADDGRALGGIVRVDTRELPRDGWHGSADASVLDGSAFVTGTVGDRVRLAVAGRYGWLDGVVSAIGNPGSAAVFPIPRYDDYQAKLELDLRARESLSVLFLGSHDELTQVGADADPAHTQRATTTTGFERLALRYERTESDGARVDVTPWVGSDTSRFDGQFGSTPALLEEHDLRWGLRADHRSRLDSRTTLALGVDGTGTHASLSRSGSFSLPARENDVTVFGEVPGDDTASDAWRAAIVDVAPYAILDFDWGPVTVTPSLRADAYLIDASRTTPKVGLTPAIGSSRLDFELEPRFSSRVRLSRRVVALVAGGIYTQPPAPSDLSAVFGSPALGPESAYHASVGESVEITPTLSATVLGFYKRMTDLAVRDPSPTPKLAHALLQDGVGRSYGVQVMLRQRRWHGFSGWVACTISRSERRDAPGASYHLADEDEPDVLALAGNQAVGPFTFGARFRFASGLPRTPVTGALYDDKDDVYQPIFGAQNSIRLPDFWQLDLRVDRRFSLGARARLSIYLEALNVTNHPNAAEYEYTAAYAKRGVITGLPALGVLGARLDL